MNYLTFAAILLFTVGLPASGQQPDALFDVSLRTTQMPSLSRAGEFVVSVRALQDSPDAQLTVRVWGGLIVSGDAVHTLSLRAGEIVERVISVRFQQAGIHRIFASVAVPDSHEPNDLHAGGRTRVAKNGVAGLYVAVGSTESKITDVAGEHFVPPGMRASMRTAAINWDTIAPAQMRHDEVRYFTRPGLSRPHSAYARVLHELQNAGVDALFEDSLAQVGRLTAARARDLSPSPFDTEGQSTLLSGVSASLGSSQSCPVNHVIRSGSFRYTHPTAGLVGAPRIYIEAASAPWGFQRNITAWFTNADGTFTVCVPFDANGYTFITIWQYNGYVDLWREGVSSSTPRSVFPSGWEQVWNLSQSSTLPLQGGHDEVAGILSVFTRSVDYANQIFAVQRNTVKAWYWDNVNINYYCSAGFPINPFSGCTNWGEGIYLHRWAQDAQGGTQDQVWSSWGQFTLAHEYGHAWDNAILGGIGGPCNGQHFLGLPNTEGCAVREGWADFFSVLTLKPDLGPFVDAEWTPFGGPQGPQIEGAFMTYLWDLVDHSFFPAHRTSPSDGDMLALAPEHIMRVLRDGRTNNGRIRTVAEFIAVLDDVTPVPWKAEFANHVQPTHITTRVQPPSGYTQAANASLWRREIFGLTPPSLLVTAAAPSYVGDKKFYPLSGSANDAVSIWQWDRSDNGAPWGYWDNQQHSGFIAYGGEYTINWRLLGQRYDGISAYDYASTQVCVAVNCSPEPLDVTASLADTEPPSSSMTGPRTTTASGAASSVPSLAPSGSDHFGSGIWLGAILSGVPQVAQLYSLTGAHEAAGSTWPSFVGRSETRQESRGGPFATTASFTRISSQPGIEEYRIVVAGLRESVTGGYVGIVLDPDLGARPEDDLLGWDTETGLVWVADPDSGVVGYVVRGNPAAGQLRVRQFSSLRSGRADPSSPAAVYSELSAPESYVTEAVDDVRMVLAVGPLTLGPNAVVINLVILRASSLADLRSRAANIRGNSIASNDAPGSLGTLPASFEFSQALPIKGSPEGVQRLQNDILMNAEAGMTLAAPSTLRQSLREEGITALGFSVPGGTSSQVRIRIYDPQGRLVRTLLDEEMTPGNYRIQWDKLSDGGASVAPGPYVAVMEAGRFRSTRPLVVVP